MQIKNDEIHKEKHQFCFLGDNNVGIIEFVPFNMYHIDLLRKGWAGFKIDSVNQFWKRCKEDRSFWEKVRYHYNGDKKNARLGRYDVI